MTTDSSSSPPRVVRDCTLDWAKVDAAVARDGSLDPTAKALYMALATFVDKDGRESDKNPEGYDVPTRKVLAECIGKDVKTVDRATERLEAYRIEGLPLLAVERRKDPHNPKANIPNVYRLLDTDRWDKRAGERFAAKHAGGRDMDVPRGRDTSVATPPGGRDMDVPRGRDTSVAVPITSQKTYRDTHPAAADNQRKQGVQEPVCVTEFRASAETVIRRSLHPEADQRLRQRDRELLIARVTVLMQQGWTLVQLAKALGGHTDAKTRRPDVVLANVLDKVEEEQPPAAGRGEADHVQTLTEALDRARRLLDDGPEFTRVTRWLNSARPAEVADWMAQADEEIRGAAAADEDPDPALRVASLLPTKTEGEVRRMAAARAEELGMSTAAAQQWAAARRKFELLPWLRATREAQAEALSVAA